jgi:hypothetical protein
VKPSFRVTATWKTAEIVESFGATPWNFVVAEVGEFAVIRLDPESRVQE